MRKLHQQIGQQINTFLRAIENNDGTNITNVKRTDQNTLVWVRHISNVYNPPVEMVDNVEWVVTVQHCETDIVTVGIDENDIMYCHIDKGGRDTREVKSRINAALQALNLPYHLHIKNYRMQLMVENEVLADVYHVVPNFNGSYLITKQM